eukprot:TRINITY_DN47090_c0_g1_i1.p1 TRINITY_DN47090_c0_g1~~TRINITY_DN47090_c0_g1_i1.p1  ORF type:complete len:735 (+),score=123.88 TRINITY_DN47090_c0_g1_i1:60-2264(+)
MMQAWQGSSGRRLAQNLARWRGTSNHFGCRPRVQAWQRGILPCSETAATASSSSAAPLRIQIRGCADATETLGVQQHVAGTDTDVPNQAQLKMVFLASALPFVGFGFLDNFLMILCGEFIDNTLCVAFNFSTMAAAAIGNTISDAAGIFSGGAVENLARKAGVEEPPMTAEQRIHAITKRWQYAGQLVGIVIGCTLGCCPLLWMDPNEGVRQRREKEREEVFDSVITKVCEILQAEALTLMFVDEASGDLVSSHQSANLPSSFRWRVNEGFMGHVYSTGQFVNIADVKDEALYNPALHDDFLHTGIKVQSILCMPVFQGKKVTGLVAVINKMGNGIAFSQKDEDVLSAICSHISVAMADDKQSFEQIIDLCQQSMQLQGSPEYSTSVASQRMATLFVPALEGIRNVLGAEATSLLLLDQASQELYTEVIDGPLPPHRTPVGVGVAGQAVQSGHLLNVDCRSSGWFNASRHTNYQGSGLEVRSELVAPLFDTSRKCLGAIKCINKSGGPAFSKADEAYVQEVAHHIGMLLEGPDAGLRRVLALSRQRMQQKSVIQGMELGKGALVCSLVRGENLPSRAAEGAARRNTIDPYITFTIVRGDPLSDGPDLQKRLLQARNKDRKAAIRRFAKSDTILEDANPVWDATIALAMPAKYRDVDIQELWVRVFLWDYDSLKPDDLVAQMSFPLSEVQDGQIEQVTPRQLMPIPGQEGIYDLSDAKLWLSVSTCDSGASESAV